MRLVEFLITLLEAQAQTLIRLAAIFGEDALIELMEHVGDQDDETPALDPMPKLRPSAKRTSGEAAAYAEIDDAISHCGLPPPLRFYLWAFPPYRMFIETPLDLDSQIPLDQDRTGERIVTQAVDAAHSWLARLPIPPTMKAQVDTAVAVPWVRFRSTVLARIGHRPLKSID